MSGMSKQTSSRSKRGYEVRAVHKDEVWLMEARRRLAQVVTASDMVSVVDQLGLPPRPIRSPNTRA